MTSTGPSFAVSADPETVPNRLDELISCPTPLTPTVAPSSCPAPVEPTESGLAAAPMVLENMHDWSRDALISHPTFGSPTAGRPSYPPLVEPTEALIRDVVDVGSRSMENVRTASAGNDVVRLGPAKPEDDDEQPEPFVFTRRDWVSKPSVAANVGSFDGADTSEGNESEIPRARFLEITWWTYIPPQFSSAASRRFRMEAILDVRERCIL